MNESSKQIWVCPVLGDNRARLIERCARLVATSRPDAFVYLAASHPLLEIVSAGILDGSTNAGLWGELPVYLFRGFVQRILSTTVDVDTGVPLLPRTHVDSEELPVKRSLISQILRRLHSEQKLKALGPLANREGCVSTVATLIGEIQRAARTPAELQRIVAERAAEYYEHPVNGDAASVEATKLIDAALLQRDFNQEVSLIYETYASLLKQNHLTDDDADGLQALAALRGEIDGRRVQTRIFEHAQLLVIDGFFDFTPLQGELLRLLVPQFSEVVVNLNGDERNPEIFKPFEETIKQLCAMVDFEISHGNQVSSARGSLGYLPERLFNTTVSNRPLPDESDGNTQAEIHYFDSTDRETEIRAIAKEVKRLLLQENYTLSEIALVVRERASYAETIARVMAEESLPCNIDRCITVTEIPAARALLKLLSVLDDLAREESSGLKMPHLADQIKSGYFRLSHEEIAQLATQFDHNYSHLFSDEQTRDGAREEWRRQELSIGRWDPDMLENVIAYVGSELRLTDWLARARKLITELPAAGATRELLDMGVLETDHDDEQAQLEDAETAQPKDPQEKKRRPQRDVHPAAIAWAAMLIKQLATRIQAVPREGHPAELRSALLKLLNVLRFRSQVMKPIRRTEDRELPHATTDMHALEALRRALLAAIKSIEITAQYEKKKLPLTTFIAEVRRCLSSQTVLIGGTQRNGLRVLEATDVRGLSFRAIFVAGLIEGGFPLAPSRDWIYPHEERARLKRYGLTLEDISPASLLKEEHYFYQTACRAIERLYLTRPLLLEGETETVASYYIEEVRRAVAPAKIRERPVARPDYDGKQLDDSSSPQELTIGLVRQEQQHFSGPKRYGLPADSEVTRLLSLAQKDGFLSESALRRIAIERERSRASFGPYDGQIDNADLLLLLSRRFGPEFVHSASGLSTFGNCPYRFFGQRVLKLQPRGEAALDLTALDAGKLLHDILRRFFERHRGKRLDPLKREQLTAELLRIADDVFAQHQRVVPPLNRQIWKLDCEIRKIILSQVLLFELDTQEKTAAKQVVPSRFELAFGMKSNAMDCDSIDKPLRLTRSQETLSISGQIDRVDIAHSDQTVIAYDYKLSKGARKKDILEGRNLQIPIYLDALEQLFFPNQPIAGGGYYTLRGGSERRNTGMYRKEFNAYLKLQARTSLFSEDEWHELRARVRSLIWNFLDYMRAGSFLVQPSEGEKTCKFCDYSAVCRYDKYRIERKH